LRPVGILFPHISDDARSKALQMNLVFIVGITKSAQVRCMTKCRDCWHCSRCTNSNLWTL